MPVASVRARWFRFEILYFILGAFCWAFAALFLPESLRENDMIGGNPDIVILPGLSALAAIALWFTYFVGAAARLEFDGAIVRYHRWREDGSVRLQDVTDISMDCRPTIMMSGNEGTPKWRLHFWTSAAPVKETKSGSFWRRNTTFGETPMDPPAGAKLLLEASLEPFWDREVGAFIKALLSAKPSLRLDEGVRSRYSLT